MAQDLAQQDISAGFREAATKYPGISAWWREEYKHWVLTPDFSLPGSALGLVEARQDFEALATAAVRARRWRSRLPDYRGEPRKPWQLWLDLLRRHLEGRRDPRYADRGGGIYVSVGESALMHKTGQSVYQVRKQRGGYTTYDEFREADGFVIRHPDGRKVHDGNIARLFEASADFWEYLEARGVSQEVKRRKAFIAPYIAPTPGRHWTLSQLADFAELPQSSLSRWFDGKRALKKESLEKLAKCIRKKFGATISAADIPNG
jgi:hypothetical protein